MRVLICKMVLLCCLCISMEASIFKGWNLHFSYRNVETVTTRSHDVLVTGNGYLFTSDLHSSYFQTLSKLDGFHESIVSFTHYDPATGKSFIVYNNGSIDMVKDQQIVYNPLISNSITDRVSRINECMVDRDVAYFSTSNGIVALDHVANKVLYVAAIVKDTAVSHVLSCALMDGEIYAATTRGIYHAAYHANLMDANQWRRVSDPSSSKEPISKLHHFGGVMYSYRKKSGISTFYPQEDGGYIWSDRVSESLLLGMKLSNGHLLYYSDHTVNMITPKGVVHRVSSLSSIKDVAYLEDQNAIAVAAAQQGYYALVWDAQTNTYRADGAGRYPSGPYLNYPWSLTADKQRLYMVSGRYNGTVRHNIPGAIMIYHNGWSSITAADIAADYKGNFADLTDIAIDPRDPNRYFVASWGEGLYEFYNDRFANLYNATNSTIEQDEFNNFKSEKLGALAFDTNHNLWMTNSGSEVNRRIKVKLNDGRWGGFNAPPTTLPYSSWAMYDIITPTTSGVIVASYNSDYKGLSIFEPKGDFGDIAPNDIKMVIPFRDIKGNIIPTIRYCAIVEDHKQEVWVGTDNGIVVIPKVTDFREDYFYTYRPEVTYEDGQKGNLLEYETVNAIVVAADNSKWLATDSDGLYHVSSDGSQILAHYTQSNSPLVSNTIITLAFVEQSNELFIGTILGVVSMDLSIVSDLPTPSPDYETITPYLTISLYPTITRGDVKYQSNINEPLVLSVYNKLGQLCWTELVAEGSFDLSGLAEGIYFCKFVQSSGASSKALPIIIGR